ncbi:MAG: copper chaperone PCu(A)C [Pseudomonadota bacterium]|nr:copper chaperone PCu(A)C [Pseudomonadota bacterium]
MKAGKILLPVLFVLAMVIALALALTGGGSLGGKPAPLLTNATLVPIMGAEGDFALFLNIENRGAPERLTGASSPEAGQIGIDGTDAPEGLVIPGGTAPSLSSDGAFLRLSGLTGPVEEGRLVPLRVHFAGAGDIATRARIATATPSHAMHGMDAAYDVPAGETPPRIGVVLSPDGDDWQVRLDLRDITLSPDTVDMPHQPGQGHAHLYLNGLKLQRMYTPEARIGTLPPGRHIVEVTLNTNDHRAFRVNGETVSAIAMIDMR